MTPRLRVELRLPACPRLELGLGAAVPTSVPPDWPPEAEPELPLLPA